MLIRLNVKQIEFLLDPNNTGNWIEIGGQITNITGQAAYSVTNDQGKTNPRVLFSYRKNSQDKAIGIGYVTANTMTATVQEGYEMEFRAALKTFQVPGA